MNRRIEFSTLPWPAEAGEPEGRELRGFTLRSEGGWLALVDPERGDASSGLGSPGPWRVVPDGTGFTPVMDVPKPRGVEALGDLDGERSLDAVLDWAAATRRGELPAGWMPPPRDEVESWLASGRLRARSGPHIARGELVLESRRLALVFPRVASVPADLPAPRRAWLDALLVDAQRRWRLVRLGVEAPAGPATDQATPGVRAEVDLSGVPAAWAPTYVQLSLEALRRAVAWVLSPLSFVADPGTPSRALARDPFPSLVRSETR